MDITTIGVITGLILNFFGMGFGLIKFISFISESATEKAHLINRIEQLEKNKVETIHFELLKRDVDYIKSELVEIKNLLHQLLDKQ